MKKQPKLILFDMMGTLLLHREGDLPYWYRLGAWVESADIMTRERFNEKYTAWRKRRGAWGTREITLRERLEEILPELSDQHEFLDNLISAYMLEYESKTAICEGAEEMLNAWAQIVKIGVVSNFFVPGFPERLLKRHGLSKYLNFIIDSSQVGYRKPAREIYVAALLKAGIEERDTDQVIFIGDDKIADIEGPMQIGMSAFLYSDLESIENSVTVIRSWNDFRP